MVLKLDMRHRGLKLYKIYINDGHGLTMTYFTAVSCMRKSATKSFNEGKPAANGQIDGILMFLIFLPHGVVCLCPGAFYMYMSIIFKHLL